MPKSRADHAPIGAHLGQKALFSGGIQRIFEGFGRIGKGSKGFGKDLERIRKDMEGLDRRRTDRGRPTVLGPYFDNQHFQ